MPLSDRDYMKDAYPPNCTCVDCVNKRLGIVKHKKQRYKRGAEKPLDEHAQPPTSPTPAIKTNKRRMPNWLKALLLTISLSGIGLGVSYYVGSFIPFWILFGFSIIYSIEKWFSYITRKYKAIGKLYRLSLNLAILSVLGLLIWSGIKLFSQQFFQSSIIGSLIFIAEFVFFIWIWRIVSKNSWRWPSMKLTFFSLAALFLIFAYAGVQPVKDYKDIAFSNISSVFKSSSQDTTDLQQSTTTPTLTATIISTHTPTPSKTKTNEIDDRTGEYKNYYLGLVKETSGVMSGNDCYGEFIILVNNKNAKNPTYSELLNFLKSDETDEFPYQYTASILGFYYGEAEDKIDLDLVKNIIDGIEQPEDPRICADFAERLHNNAEMAGIRCAYVDVNLSGYTDPFDYGISSNTGHALCAFETTDKGLVYIDDTSTSLNFAPSNCDKIVDVQIGKAFIPESIFPEPGWYSTWDSMGVVTDIFITWDGEWR